ncbi:MAG: LysM peptidoglycan-binding domain-containing protein [Actinomycetota bacterium]
MSAAVAWELAPTPGRMPLRAARPQLRLVMPGERQVAPLGLAPRVRINRRGRLLLTLTILAGAVTLALTLATSVMASSGTDAPQIDHATTVSSGQTLSEVAAAQLPGLPINEGVARIQLANGLNTVQVHAGQSLLIPAMP